MPAVRALLVGSLALMTSACEHREVEPAPPDQRPGPQSPEPVAVRRGQRMISVRCERACGPAQVELSRLQRDCVRDPSSNVHHVSERPAMIQLGCCAEASGAFSDACGDEGSMGGCLARWSRFCERGTLLELDEPPAETDRAGGPS